MNKTSALVLGAVLGVAAFVGIAAVNVVPGGTTAISATVGSVVNTVPVTNTIFGVDITGTNAVAATAAMINAAQGTFTYATVPASPSVGESVYCSDVLTPWGTGSRIEWAGTEWEVVGAKIPATATLDTYMLYLASSMWEGTTSLSQSRVADYLASNAHDRIGLPFQSGAGASATTLGSAAGRNYVSRITGTANNGSAGLFGALWTPTSGERMMLIADVQIPNLCDGTETYWLLFGTDYASGGTFSTTGNFFLYDLYNTQSVLAGGDSHTNQWLCVSRSSSVNTINLIDTAVVSTGWTRLAMLMSTDRTVFYINGTSVSTNTTVPSAAQYCPKVTICKTAGTTSRTFNQDWIASHIRYATARDTFP